MLRRDPEVAGFEDNRHYPVTSLAVFRQTVFDHAATLHDVMHRIHVLSNTAHLRHVIEVVWRNRSLVEDMFARGVQGQHYQHVARALDLVPSAITYHVLGVFAYELLHFGGVPEIL